MMKIYSWNVFCYNRHIPKVAEYIRDLDFDVLCLQEVTPQLLTALKLMPFHLAYHIDVIRLFMGGKQEHNYVAILSKQPFVNKGSLQFFNFPFPFHTRIFIFCMSLWRFSFATERGAVYVDVPFRDTTLRIFSVHLTLWGPDNRAKEFDAVMDHVEPSAPTVIAGDFNVIEYGPMKILNWLMGAPLSKGMPWYPERDLFEERFVSAGFNNPLRGKVTHPFSRSQLDHILVSKDLTVGDVYVEKERHGSDHQAVSVTLTERQ
jgi:endonuclease/exonuclease/phosphatase family metal-dependent hydrolase